ncbi:hypothetical protein GCK32_021868, partial [Trichostrongylus colubriformis]
PSAQMTYVGCEYKPGGNMLNDYIYEIGDPCTRNEHCKCDNCTCSTEEGLCIRPDSTPMPGDVNSQTQQERGNRFTLPQGDDWMSSQDLKTDFFSKPLSFNLMKFTSQQKDDDLSSQPFGFSSINSHQQQNGDLFSKILGPSWISSQKQQGKHEWTTEPHGNGFKWSYSWSS